MDTVEVEELFHGVHAGRAIGACEGAEENGGVGVEVDERRAGAEAVGDSARKHVVEEALVRA